MRLQIVAAIAATTGVLLAGIAPAGAELPVVIANALTLNALTFNALTFNGIAPTGSRLGELNGVAVEAVQLPAAR